MDFPNNTPAVCKACGKQLAPEDTFCTGCGQPVNKTKSIPVFTIVKIAIAVLLFIIAISLIGKATDILNSQQMQRLVQHMEECVENRRECQKLMRESSGYFATEYRKLVESYDELIANDEADIAALKKEASTNYIFAGLCFVAAGATMFIPWKRRLQYGAG